MKKVILDVDTGIDDALAILFAMKSNDLKVEGITTGYGNVNAALAAENTLKVVELVNSSSNIPVTKGAEKPLFRPAGKPVVHVHGSNGIGDYELPKPKQKVLKESSADFIVRKVNEQPGELTLIFVGRLTNLAIALAKDPSIAKKVDRLVIMGGALKTSGNITPVAEANIYGDPEAAHRVFESGIPLTMVGLDVTKQARFTKGHLEKLSSLMPVEQKELSAFIKHIIDFGIHSSIKMKEGSHRLMHDPLAVGVAIDAGVVETEDFYVYVETKGSSAGATVADLRGEQEQTNASVCLKIKEEHFINQLIETLVAE